MKDSLSGACDYFISMSCKIENVSRETFINKENTVVNKIQ